MISVASFQPKTREFAVEESPAGTAGSELSVEALRLRVRQQEILGEFGVLALKGTTFPELLSHAAAPKATIAAPNRMLRAFREGME